MNDFPLYEDEFLKQFDNLNDFPLKISLFRRYPTCLMTDELPPIFRTSYFMKETWRSSGYGGVDGITLANMAKALNFSAEIVTPDGIDFGYRMQNGTFAGYYFIFYVPFSHFQSFYFVLEMQELSVQCYIDKHMLHSMDVFFTTMGRMILNTCFHTTLINFALLHQKL